VDHAVIKEFSLASALRVRTLNDIRSGLTPIENIRVLTYFSNAVGIADYTAEIR
jgi:hypothetical protein